jgi:hypothetical protein
MATFVGPVIFQETDMAKLTEAQLKWKTHIDAAKAAGQTLKGYAREHNLNVQTLYGHSRRLNKATKSPARPGFVRVAASAGAPGAVRIDLPNGVRVHMSTPSDLAELLRQVSCLP